MSATRVPPSAATTSPSPPRRLPRRPPGKQGAGVRDGGGEVLLVPFLSGRATVAGAVTPVGEAKASWWRSKVLKAGFLGRSGDKASAGGGLWHVVFFSPGRFEGMAPPSLSGSLLFHPGVRWPCRRLPCW